MISNIYAKEFDRRGLLWLLSGCIKEINTNKPTADAKATAAAPVTAAEPANAISWWCSLFSDCHVLPSFASDTSDETNKLTLLGHSYR